MQGKFFTVISPDPKVQGRMLIKLGVVKKELGDCLVLTFQAKDYNFTNIIHADKLVNFAFFDTAEQRQQFLRELMASASPIPSDPEAPAASEPKSKDPADTQGGTA
jgi:hypothetical protein